MYLGSAAETCILFINQAGPTRTQKPTNGTLDANAFSVAHAYPKTVEVAAKSSLIPCILDDDPAQLEMLSAVVEDMGYESVCTSDPEEALKLVRYGRCRLVLADVHI